jgi:hypothetical protein
MNQAVRLYMPDMAGHSILNWTGPAVACSVGMEALTLWTEEGKAPDVIPTVRYNFQEDKAVEEGSVKSFDQWEYKKKIRRR